MSSANIFMDIGVQRGISPFTQMFIFLFVIFALIIVFLIALEKYHVSKKKKNNEEFTLTPEVTMDDPGDPLDQLDQLNTSGLSTGGQAVLLLNSLTTPISF